MMHRRHKSQPALTRAWPPTADACGKGRKQVASFSRGGMSFPAPPTSAASRLNPGSEAKVRDLAEWRRGFPLVIPAYAGFSFML
jgi:hypothetical protein